MLSSRGRVRKLLVRRFANLFGTRDRVLSRIENLKCRLGFDKLNYIILVPDLGGSILGVLTSGERGRRCRYWDLDLRGPEYSSAFT